MLIIQQIMCPLRPVSPHGFGSSPGGVRLRVCVRVCVCVVCTRVYICYEYEDVNRPLDIPHE